MNCAINTYTATVDGWDFSATAGGGRVDITPHMPEQLSLKFLTTGGMGGDAGHGGHAVLEAYAENGGVYSFTPAMTSPEGAMITAEGDWELQGLAAALVLLGRILEAEGLAKVTSFAVKDAAQRALDAAKRSKEAFSDGRNVQEVTA